MAFMEKDNVFDKQYAEWFDIAENVQLQNGRNRLAV